MRGDVNSSPACDRRVRSLEQRDRIQEWSGITAARSARKGCQESPTFGRLAAVFPLESSAGPIAVVSDIRFFGVIASLLEKTANDLTVRELAERLRPLEHEVGAIHEEAPVKIGSEVTCPQGWYHS